jgi:hypothetical protein
MRNSRLMVKSIRRINATPLDIKAGNWRQDTHEISLYSVSIYSSP